MPAYAHPLETIAATERLIVKNAVAGSCWTEDATPGGVERQPLADPFLAIDPAHLARKKRGRGLLLRARRTAMPLVPRRLMKQRLWPGPRQSSASLGVVERPAASGKMKPDTGDQTASQRSRCLAARRSSGAGECHNRAAICAPEADQRIAAGAHEAFCRGRPGPFSRRGGTTRSWESIRPKCQSRQIRASSVSFTRPPEARVLARSGPGPGSSRTILASAKRTLRRFIRVAEAQRHVLPTGNSRPISMA